MKNFSVNKINFKKLKKIIFLKNFRIYSLLLANAFLGGLVLSSFVESKLFIANTHNIGFIPKFYNGDSGRQDYSIFQNAKNSNFLLARKTESKTAPKENPDQQAILTKKKHLAELQKIANNFHLQGTIIFGITSFAIIYHKQKKINQSFQQGKNIFDSRAILHKVNKENSILALGAARLDLKIKKIKSPDNIIFSVTPKKTKPKTKPAKQPQKKNNIPINNNKKNQQKVLKDLTQAIEKENFEGIFDFNQPNAIKIDNDNISVKKDYFQGALKNLPVILGHANAIPYKKNTEFLGYKLTNVKKDGIFDRLGFKKNDIITKVNGQPVKNLTQIMEFFSVLKNENAIAVDVLRETNIFTINYSLN